MMEEEQEDKVQMFGHSLSKLAQEQIGIRQQIEERWLEDLERYMGKYDAATLKKLNMLNSSQAFINFTRSKTAAAEARIADMLFPSDDKNWAIEPTPVPELIKIANDTRQITNKSGELQIKPDGEPLTYAEFSEDQVKNAKEKSDAMAKEIEDQLQEADYHSVARNVIHDACLFGTGIIKGPVVINRTRKKWNQVDGGVYSLTTDDEYRPGVEHVKVWDFFPEMSATDLSESGFIFERRYITKKQLIKLAKNKNYFSDHIRQILAEEPTQISSSGSTHIAKMRELSGISANLDDNRYEMWEYHGPAEKETLIQCGCDIEDDELVEHDVVVTFIGNHVIKVDMNPMETEDHPYSVFSYEEDDTSVFGFGVPYLLSSEQRVSNAAWRLLLDNAALSSRGQVVVNRELITPSDGSWDLRAGKIWWNKDPNTPVNNAFNIFEIPSHQAELAAIYTLSREMADDVTSLPMLSQGEQGDAPDTAAGMSMKMNAANVVLRRIIKSFDDNITRPFISRFYDWNMQNSDKEEIKGDFEVNARGSSALLVKETQTQALMAMMQFAQQPVFGELTKHVELYRKVAQAQHISQDEVIKTDEELKAEETGQGKQSSAEVQIAQLEAQDKEAERQIKLQIAQYEGQVDIQVAQIRSFNESEKTNTDMQKTQLSEDNKANLFLAEKQFAETTGDGRGL